MSASSPQSQGPIDFPQFSKLPKELRLTIWELVLPGRVVHLQKARLKRLLLCEPEWELGYEYCKKELEGPHIHNCGKPLYGFRSRSKIPPATFACKESFEVTAGAGDGKMFASQDAEGTTYFNFKRDTLYLHLPGIYDLAEFQLIRWELCSITDKENLNKVENLAIHLRRMPAVYYRSLEQDLAFMFYKFFPNLQSFTIVLRHHVLEYTDPNGRSLDMGLMKPLDLNTAFTRPDIARTYGGLSAYFWSMVRQGCLTPIYGTRWATLDLDEFRKQMSLLQSTGLYRRMDEAWRMPRFELGMVVPSQLKEDLASKRRAIDWAGFTIDFHN